MALLFRVFLQIGITFLLTFDKNRGLFLLSLLSRRLFSKIMLICH